MALPVVRVAMWIAGGVWLWAVITSRLGLRLYAVVAIAALMLVRATILWWIERRSRPDFDLPRSAYPDGDNGYNRNGRP